MERNSAGTPDTDWFFPTWEAGTSDRDSYICDSDIDFNCGGAYDLQSVVVCVDVIVSGVVASVYYALLYAGEWGAEDVCAVW